MYIILVLFIAFGILGFFFTYRIVKRAIYVKKIKNKIRKKYYGQLNKADYKDIESKLFRSIFSNGTRDKLIAKYPSECKKFTMYVSYTRKMMLELIIMTVISKLFFHLDKLNS